MLDIEKMASRTRSVLTTISLVGVFVFLAGTALTVAAASNTAQKAGENWISGIAQANGTLVLAALGILIACMPWGVLQIAAILIRRAHDERYHHDQLLGALETQAKAIEHLRDVTTLSDAAKQVAYRTKDLEALRTAIREDLGRGDFEAATMLVNEMERRFGYALEADKIREQINTSSRAAIDQRVADTVEHVELLLTRYEWDDANRECDRLLRLFPTHPEARKLPDKITVARDGHKRELLKMWKEAVTRDDVDRSLELLRELDQYLSSAEAEAYKESARDVFRKKLQQLGVQFALHVHDKNWLEALRIGRQITDEFPNTRMAAEVRERLAILEVKAGP
jgi:negative regulator of replication initiation